MTDITCRVCCMLKLCEIVTEVLCLEQGDDGKLMKPKFPKRRLNWFTNCLAARTVSRVFLFFFFSWLKLGRSHNVIISPCASGNDWISSDSFGTTQPTFKSRELYMLLQDF